MAILILDFTDFGVCGEGNRKEALSASARDSINISRFYPKYTLEI